MLTAAEILEEYTGDRDGLGELIEDLVTAYSEAGGQFYVGAICAADDPRHIEILGLYADERTADVDTDTVVADRGDDPEPGQLGAGVYPLTIRPVPADQLAWREQDRKSV